MMKGFVSGEASQSFEMGRFPGISFNYFNGSLDEVMIFNRSLSAVEIKSLYVSGSVDHSGDGVGVDWVESSSGLQSLVVLNSTHLGGEFVVDSGSEWLLPEVSFESGGFYSGIVEGVSVVSSDVVGPVVEFVEPTPADGSSQSDDFVYVNVSVVEDGESSAFLDWNGSLVGWWGFDACNSTGCFDNSSYSNFSSASAIKY